MRAGLVHWDFMSRSTTPTGRAHRHALAALGGLLLVVAHTPWPGVGAAAPLALILLLSALSRLGQRASFAVGFGFGLAFHLVGYHWLVHTMVTFGGFPRPIAILFFILIGAYQALSVGLVGFLAARLRARGVATVLGFPLAVATMESLYPLLFPSYVASALHQWPILLQPVELGGPILVSAALAVVAVCGQCVAASVLRREPVPRRELVVGVGVLVVWVGYGAARSRAVAASEETRDRLVIGLVQANVPVKESQTAPAVGHARHLVASRRLVREHELDLLVWPESGYPYVLPDGARMIAPEVMRGGSLGVPFLFGASRGDVRGRDFNTAFLLGRDGTLLGTYDKNYLLMFGEYLPFGDVFPRLYDLSPGTARLTPGEHQEPLVFAGTRLSILMCYEDLLPGFTRRVVRAARPHVLVNLTNDAWFGDTVEPWFHLALSKLRAIESRRWLVRSTNTGVSAFVDPVGRVVRHGGLGTEETLVQAVTLRDDLTLYARVGDWPGAFAAALMLWLLVTRRSATVSKTTATAARSPWT